MSKSKKMLIYNFVRPYNHLHYGVSSITESFFCVDKWTSRGGAISKKNCAFLNLFKSFKVIPKELFGLNNPNLLFSILEMISEWGRWYLSINLFWNLRNLKHFWFLRYRRLFLQKDTVLKNEKFIQKLYFFLNTIKVWGSYWYWISRISFWWKLCTLDLSSFEDSSHKIVGFKFSNFTNFYDIEN